MSNRRLVRLNLLWPTTAQLARWVSLLICILYAHTGAAEEMALRAVSGFEEGTILARSFESFIKKVNEEGTGLIRINFLGGPRIMPPHEIGHAIETNIIDIGVVSYFYYDKSVPITAALYLAQKDWPELRRNGTWELINRFHIQNMNSWFLARLGDKMMQHIYLNQEINNLDLSGITIRSTSVTNAFFSELGANPIVFSISELRNSLESNFIQGYGAPSVGVIDRGLANLTKFRIEPGFYRSANNVLVNVSLWQRMIPAQRNFLTRMAAWLETEDRYKTIELVRAETELQERHGIKPIVLSETDRAVFLKKAQEAGWNELQKKLSPETYQELFQIINRN